MTIRSLVLLALSALAIGVPALAQDTSAILEARRAGIVGERYDGYMGYPGTPQEAIRRQVGAINIRRRSLYTDLADRRNATVQEVGIAAGCELLEGVKAGEIYMLGDGSWHRRAAGEPVPAPSYCPH